MDSNSLNYTNFPRLIGKYKHKGRSESASFLNWFLENIYRLTDVDADDSICDEHNDKGIDGIYVDTSTQEIHLFQSKISQRHDRTLGDSDIKSFVGAMEQFNSPESIEIILSGNANPDLKKIIQRNNIKQLLSDGYKVVGIFISNQMRDNNCSEYVSHIKNMQVYDRSRILLEYVDFDADEGVKGEFSFDVSYANFLEFTADENVKIFMFPCSALELIKLKGIDDTTLFKQNVRLSLGNTSVNKSIAESISDPREHKNFPLYHNGITILCGSATPNAASGELTISDYVVVNGAQSISTFYKNAANLSKDLRVFTKIIALRDEALARKITLNSNNQNAIKARDLRSNHNIMLRLKAEFSRDYPDYYFEIKRGEIIPDGKHLISNEYAGRLLMAFDLDEPYSCHQIYKVFDEKYADIFGRPEVTASRIMFCNDIFSLICSHIGELKNEPMAGYALTRFFLLNVIRHMMNMSDLARNIISSREILADSSSRDHLLSFIPSIVSAMLIDFNYELTEEGDTLDYKRDLKSPERVRSWRNKLLVSYEKEVKKGRATRFGD